MRTKFVFMSWIIVCWISIIVMTLFNLQTFVENPSVELFERCRKDDLLSVAAHFQIPVVKQALKREIKNVVWNRLVELQVLVGPVSEAEFAGAEGFSPNPDMMDQGNVQSELSEPVLGTERRTGLSPFDPFSPVSSGSKEDTKLKVRLARLQMEAQDKAQTREAELDLRLKIRTLEIESEKQVKMRQLELEAMKIVGGTAVPVPPEVTRVPSRVVSASPVASSSSATNTFDVGKYISLVPHFRETEVDSYF
jgi:hypothetical protein